MNDDNDIIQFITEKLEPYPEIRYKDDTKDQIEIFTNDINGFDIVLYTSATESILYLDHFHQHFEHTDHDITTLIYLIFYALTGRAKLEVLYKNNKPYQYNLQVLNDNGDWYIYKTMKSVFYKFWQKTTKKYLQNKSSVKFL
ncbi:hypothetical protein [Wohlfahrtiimonas larvae]|uniref:Uncharacterized protein n=1 Tax=Wohlfahrtiimonas larvae TaxID=1157986 RepID=A0ABP9MKZ6_9GAMM|nr:hypothetical protein [Wohlfahrtiimonas larvae]